VNRRFDSVFFTLFASKETGFALDVIIFNNAYINFRNARKRERMGEKWEQKVKKEEKN